jgi:trimethylamine-N-oxide reductase (cytochrome c)
MLSAMKFRIILWGLAQLMKFAAWRYPAFRARLKERNLVAQFKARDEEIGRWYAIKDGVITSGAGLRGDVDVTLAFKTARLGADLLTPPINWLDQINAQKEFNLTVEGPDDLVNWFAQTVMASMSAGLKFGTRMSDGSMRYCNMANGGPLFVFVKDGKIIRTTPIDLSEDDGASWHRARGLGDPPRKTTLAPHGRTAKSMVIRPTCSTR